MKSYQKKFIELAIAEKVLKFGEFTLKSGRLSPYFFNAGLFNSGEALFVMADCYAQKIIEQKIEFDILFGPAYKGIPLVAAISVILASKYNKNIGFAYNRKEAKDHGEGGVLVGADVEGKKVLIVDDVITAGTAIKESIDLLGNYNVNFAGTSLALDRQEKGQKMDLSAVQEIENSYDIPVFSIILLDDIVSYITNSVDFSKYMDKFQLYKKRYAV